MQFDEGGQILKEHLVSERAVKYQEFLDREGNVPHHTWEEELYSYELLRAGDRRALDEHLRRRQDPGRGHLSADPLRNEQYMTAISIALACRVAIQAGVEAKRAYTISDLYIRKMDLMDDVDEIQALDMDMFAFYLNEIAGLDKKKTYSRPVALCLDYIYDHLDEPIPLSDLAGRTGLNASYLSTLFKKEMGLSVSDYIMSKKMEAARNMLRFSDYTCAEISTMLNFSSQSHFIRAFKRHTGDTPKHYREKNYRYTAAPEENGAGGEEDGGPSEPAEAEKRPLVL